MEDFPSGSTPPSLSTQLLCLETETYLNEADEEETFVCSVPGIEEDEYVQMLLRREINGGESEPPRVSIDDWIKCARLDAIKWILKTRELFGFRFQTAYLSVAYLDRFLSRRIIDREKCWAIRLLSLACLSLAAKMEECRVPALAEFRVEEFNFGSKVIQRMELLVLNTLEWRMNSVTPFTYVHYFTKKLSKAHTPPKNTMSKAVQVILAMMRDVNLMDHRPSVIAGAAALVALDRKLTKQTLELEINSSSPNVFSEIEDLFSCYNRMQELDTGEATIPESPIRLRGMDACENSSVISALTTKRKMLTFSDSDQNCGIPLDEKRQR
ncbi:hypothetical protein RHGRI_016410 [Rhododendron griersonianum]|uniref:B-like cyclin n=1 Tax=Rhododendron griersonianum TaxID=479676 RepID=A0AAV6JU01_9ERIC|nr:hypothetical protein RHGRI_016410 [Rhododendron griersonianum]